ncbi:MAG: 3-hydroxyacyl-CoA dehydrogenase NAD-binding domain-containing protein [Gammaproteobacteria bacterium]|nr:3-hydroxyacyl-CoA dehydrogenase NAD-binding domain-containing protein [Gammaproteobacteria bacterium]
MDYMHWSIKQDENNICWLLFDYKDSATNILSTQALEELKDILEQINEAETQALIFKSMKSTGFIAGANINEFVGIDYQAALSLITLGHSVMNKIEAMKCTTISMIHGFCMGGGTELSLACDYIICSDDSATRLSLPEVKLGIHPGFGGSYRCIRRIGPLAAFDMMLTGRSINAKLAKKLKLVDEITAQRQLERAAIAFAAKKPVSRQQSIKNRLLNNTLIRGFLAKKITAKVAKKAAKKHYPAPYKLISLWLKYYDFPRKMLEKEAISVAELVADPSAQNLVRVYFLQEQLKSLGDKKLFKPLHIHVIGGGIMGGDIAAWCAYKGFQVSVQDQDPAILAKTIERAYQLFSKKLRDKRLISNTMDRLTADHKGYGVEHADIIIEAIFEDASVKQSLYQSIEPRMKKNAILATNTSSIPLETLASCLKKPGRLVGLHFFNPVALMPLVEIIHGEQSDKKTIKNIAAFSRHIDKLPLAVKSSPGFLVNRILMPYLLEAILMYAEGIPAEAIDKAALDFGMPMGPIELADTVGLDVCLSVANILAESYHKQVPEQLEHMVKTGYLGKKNNKGFYSYQNGKAQKDSTSSYRNMTDVQQRLILMLVNEATACLRDKIVDNEDLLDAGVIFGTGFAPFRGGPIKYIHDSGKHDLQVQMDGFKEQLGERFTQDNGWELV